MTKVVNVEDERPGPGPEINTEKVAEIILMAREIEGPDAEVDADASNPIDDNFTVSVTNKGATTGMRDLLGMIESLDEDEQMDLVALAWVGRGDYDVASWEEAVQAARDRTDAPPARYLSQMEMLAENLDAGLAEFGRSYTGNEVDTPVDPSVRSDGTA